MPNPLTFKEEGGASLSPDGSTFLAVRTYIDRNLAKKHSLTHIYIREDLICG